MLENYSAASLGDALKEIAGVSSINTGNAIVKPMINGMHSSRIIVMNNGVRLQDQEWGIEHAPNIDLNSSESVSVIKGAGAVPETMGDGALVLPDNCGPILAAEAIHEVLTNSEVRWNLINAGYRRSDELDSRSSSFQTAEILRAAV